MSEERHKLTKFFLIISIFITAISVLSYLILVLWEQNIALKKMTHRHNP